MEELSARDWFQVYRFVRRRTRNDADAEDLTQEVYADALQALADARVDASPDLAWLYTVARRRLIDAWRRNEDHERLDDAHLARYGPRIERTLLDAIRGLPRNQREIVVLKLVHGLPFREIASRLDVSEEACRMRLSRGLAALRERLDEEGVGS